MKRLRNRWPELVGFDNLLLAWRKARRGKGGRPDVARFALDLEGELFALQGELESGEYRPGPYRCFTIYDRKPRLISAAPLRDRVVHHTLINVVEPPLDPCFIHDSYACRRGKGVHAALDRYQGWARRYTYALQMDVRRYFPSIDHDRLMDKLARRIADRRVLALCECILAHGPAHPPERPTYFPGDDLFAPLTRRTGLPIGNLTSQFLANLYLDDFDHFVQEHLRASAYLRYVDDMVILGDDKAQLADLREAVRERLAAERLTLHPRKAHIRRTGDGLALLGYTVRPHRRRLRADNPRRFSRRLRTLSRAYAAGRIDWADVNASVQSWIGHARHADTQALRGAVLGNVVLSREVRMPAPGTRPGARP